MSLFRRWVYPLTILPFLLVMSSLALADGLPRQSPRIGVLYQAPIDDAWRGVPYAGAFVGYGYSNDSEFLGGGLLGYSWTNKLWDLGLEVDLSTNPGRTIEDFDRYHRPITSHLGDWLVSLRAKAGVYMAPKLEVFGTAGVAWEDSDSGFVYGAGGSYDLNERTSIRVDLLQYEMENTSTQLRIGGVVKLY